MRFVKVAALVGWNGNEKKGQTGKRYEVWHSNIKIGEIEKCYTPSYRSDNTQSRTRWGFRGYRLFWRAHLEGTPFTETVGYRYDSRTKAVEELVRAYQAGAKAIQELLRAQKSIFEIVSLQLGADDQDVSAPGIEPGTTALKGQCSTENEVNTEGGVQ